MVYFLLKEDTEEFWCEAISSDEAHSYASMWNAVVLRQATQEEQTSLENYYET